MAFKCTRWTLANVLPVVFVLWVLLTIWFLHVWLHIARLLQHGLEHDVVDVSTRQRGIAQAAVSQPLVAILLICFARAVFTDPGSVPDTPEWQADFSEPHTPSKKGAAEEETHPAVRELKQTGARRFCKWCNAYKPDRCHHCRVCKSCVLRMDHHCPWIANCVGFQNHKYFFLLVFYALVNCVVVVSTMWESLALALVEETSSMQRFLLVFGLTLAAIMGTLLGLFFCLHVWLMLNSTTTIEFCEKRHRRFGSNAGQPNYDRGAYENIRAVLGPNPLLWLLPYSPPLGDGLSFPVGLSRKLSDTAAAAAAEAAAQHSGQQEGANETPSEPERVALLGDAIQRVGGTPEVTGERAAAV